MTPQPILPQPMLICSSHTISGVMPGSTPAARHSFEARVQACAKAGYRGMCLHYRDYEAQIASGATDAQLQGSLAEAGIAQVELEFLSDWFLRGDAASEENEAKFWGAAKGFGARSLNLGGDFLGRGIPWPQMRARFAEFCTRAADKDLKVALEFVPFSNIAAIDQAMDLVELAPNAGLVVDSWHTFRGGISLAEIANLPAQRVLCVQINDAKPVPEGPLAQETLNRLPCGAGGFDLIGFLRAIKATGTPAGISVEIISPAFAAMDVETAAECSIEGARALFAALS